MKKVTLEISEAAYKKLYTSGMVAAIKAEPGLADLLLFKILDGIENNEDVVSVRVKEDK